MDTRQAIFPFSMERRTSARASGSAAVDAAGANAASRAINRKHMRWACAIAQPCAGRYVTNFSNREPGRTIV
jgi:hypothetical protein